MATLSHVMIFVRTICAFFGLLFLPTVSLAASSGLVDWITTVDGLPDLEVEALALDAHGYLWMGTRGGLVRHEGLTLSVLRHDPARPESLPGNNVLSLHATRDGSLWAAITGNGLVRLEGLDVQRHFRHESDGGELKGRFIWSMAEGCDDSLWAAYATDGLVRIGPDDELQHFPPGKNGFPADGFSLALAVDPSCQLWLVRADGLWRFMPDRTPSFEEVLSADDTEFSVFLALHTASANRFWLGTSSGLIELESEADHSGHVQIVNSWKLDKAVASIAPAADGVFWLGTQQGLELFDPKTGEREFRDPDAIDEERRLDQMHVTEVLTGADDELWVSTISGVARLPVGWRAFEVTDSAESGEDIGSITAIEAAAGVGFWAGNYDGQVYSIGQDGILRVLGDVSRAPSSGRIVGLNEDAGKLWMATRLVLGVFDIDRSEFQVLIRRERTQELNFNFMVPADADELWLGADGAELLRVQSSDGEVIARWASDETGARQLTGEMAIDIQRGPDQAWWLLQDNVISRLDANGRFVTRFDAGSEQLLTMSFDQDRLWLASDSTLRSFQVNESGRLQEQMYFTARDGLPAGQVRAMLTHERNLWLFTSIGLFRLDPETRQFRSFPIGDRVTDAGFNEAAVMQLEDGRFAAGTPEGLVVIDPAQIEPITSAPPVYINRVRAGGIGYPISVNEDSVLELPWTVQSFELEFQALEYQDPNRVRFRTRLEGWDSQWREFAGRGSRWYGNLSPGRYRFQVQAANHSGVWNREGDEIEIFLGSPPWLSRSAQLLYLLLAIVLVVLIVRSVRARRARRESLRQARAQKQLAEQQRGLLEQFNRSLEPEDLARSIVFALARLCRAEKAYFGFLKKPFPETVWSWPEGLSTPDHQTFVEAVSESAIRDRSEVVFLGDGKPCAAVWLAERAPPAEIPDPARVELFVQTAGQVLENARLLQQVRGLAEEARQANEAKSRFLATMSHEIRTPLHGLLGLMELLEQRLRDNEQTEMIQTMMQSGRQLHRILNDVLDLSRIEAGRLDIDTSPLELMPLLESVIDLHASTAEAKGLALRLRPAFDLPVMVRGDSDRMIQILGNLISNAIKFTSRGSVEVEARLDRDGLLAIAVIDTGPGISEHEQKRLFEPFTQADEDSTRRHSGTGLGLAICRELTDAMGGSLVLSSVPGRGSRFTVRLPLETKQSEPSMRPALLDGLRVGSAVEGADHRILRQLCRRWGIELIRLSPDQGIDATTIDALIFSTKVLSIQQVEDKQLAGLSCWQLGSKVQSPGVRMLRTPLLEKRLIGALLDERFSARSR